MIQCSCSVLREAPKDSPDPLVKFTRPPCTGVSASLSYAHWRALARGAPFSRRPACSASRDSPRLRAGAAAHPRGAASRVRLQRRLREALVLLEDEAL